MYSQKPFLIWCYLNKHLHLIFEKTISKNGVGRTWFLVYFKLKLFRLSTQAVKLKFKLDQKSSSSNFIFWNWFFKNQQGDKTSHRHSIRSSSKSLCQTLSPFAINVRHHGLLTQTQKGALNLSCAKRTGKPLRYYFAWQKSNNIWDVMKRIVKLCVYKFGLWFHEIW